jgi:hypothetical protein
VVSGIENICGSSDLRDDTGASCRPTEIVMLDVMYLAIGFGFLAVTVFYVVVCDRL